MEDKHEVLAVHEEDGFMMVPYPDETESKDCMALPEDEPQSEGQTSTEVGFFGVLKRRVSDAGVTIKESVIVLLPFALCWLLTQLTLKRKT